MIKKNNFASYVLGIIVVVLVIYGIIGIFSSNETTRDTISFSATGEVTVIPDLAVINLTVTTENKDLNEAIIENSQSMNNTITFLKNNGVDSSDIKTTRYNMYPRYEYEGEYRNRYIAGYEITQTLTIKIRDLSKVGEIISGVTENGVNNIGNIQFTVDDNQLFLEEARSIAIKNAKQKAEEISKEVGIKLGKIVGFSDNNLGINTVLEKMSFATPVADYSPIIETGESTITSSITIIYEIK